MGTNIPSFDVFEVATIPDIPSWDTVSGFCETILNQALSLAEEFVTELTPGELIDNISEGDLAAIEFPDWVTGFDDGTVSFANALAAFNEYIASLPTITPEPNIDETTVTIPTFDESPTLSDITIPEFTATEPIMDYGDEPIFVDPGAPSSPIIDTPPMPERPDMVYPEIPTITDVTLPSVPSIDLPESPDTTSPEVPVLSEIIIPDSPSYDLPSTPIVAYPDVPVLAEIHIPDPIVPAIPEKPNLTYPIVPTLTDIILPTPMVLEIPIFSAIFVDDELTAPTNTFAFNETDYASTLKDAIYNGLLTEIQDGGYGLHPTDELALWNRERDKEAANSLELVQEAKRNYGMFGFPLPPGSLTRAINKATLAANLKNSSVNREITLKRADLYWEGKKFAFTSATQLEQLLMNLHNAKWERILNAVKIQMDIAIALFNAQIARYNAKVQKYKIEADIFETLIRAEALKIDLYKAMMEGTKLQGDVQRNQIALYQGQLEGVKTRIDVYKAEIDAEVSKAKFYEVELEGARVETEVQKNQIGLYSARLEGQKLVTDVYRAQIQGEMGKADLYKAQMDGARVKTEVQRNQIGLYSSRLEGIKSLVDIYKAEIQAELAKIEIYKAEVEGAKIGTEVQKNEVDLYDARVKGLQHLVEAYKADVEASNVLMSRERLRIETYRSEVEAYSARLGAEKFKFDAYDSRIKGEIGKAQVYESQARAYSALIDGRKAQVEVNRLRLAQWSEEIKAQIDMFNAQVAEHKDIRDVQAKVFDQEVSLQGLQYQAFNSKVQGISRIYELGQTALEREYRLQIAAFQQEVENARIQIQRILGLIDAETKLTVGAHEHNARIGAAALNMLNLNASVANHLGRSMSMSAGATHTRSDNLDFAYRASDSWGMTTQYNHNYNYGTR
jgi:hypothetical protein